MINLLLALLAVANAHTATPQEWRIASCASSFCKEYKIDYSVTYISRNKCEKARKLFEYKQTICVQILR